MLVRDLREPFPLPARSAGVVVASLSMHCFPWHETVALVERIHDTLRPHGLFICRVNATDDRHFGAVGHPEIEPGLYLVRGAPKRFFDEAAVDRLFASGWRRVSTRHARTRKYIRSKALWEIVLEKQPTMQRAMATQTDDPAARACLHARLIDAPADRVFAAIADPARLARWWGPNGFTSAFSVCEFREGGAWRFVMHGPDGTDYPNENTFREIVANERVVVEHLDAAHHFVLTITLTPQGRQTRVGWHQLFDTAEHRDQVAPFVLAANEQVLDRLSAEARRG